MLGRRVLRKCQNNTCFDDLGDAALLHGFFCGCFECSIFRDRGIKYQIKFQNPWYRIPYFGMLNFSQSSLPSMILNLLQSYPQKNNKITGPSKPNPTETESQQSRIKIFQDSNNINSSNRFNSTEPEKSSIRRIHSRHGHASSPNLANNSSSSPIIRSLRDPNTPEIPPGSRMKSYVVERRRQWKRRWVVTA